MMRIKEAPLLAIRILHEKEIVSRLASESLHEEEELSEVAVSENRIYEILFPSQRETLLPPDEAESVTEFQNELPQPAKETVFHFPFLHRPLVSPRLDLVEQNAARPTKLHANAEPPASSLRGCGWVARTASCLSKTAFITANSPMWRHCWR
jgi:hypothetical protein